MISKYITPYILHNTFKAFIFIEFLTLISEMYIMIHGRMLLNSSLVVSLEISIVEINSPLIEKRTEPITTVIYTELKYKSLYKSIQLNQFASATFIHISMNYNYFHFFEYFGFFNDY